MVKEILKSSRWNKAMKNSRGKKCKKDFKGKDCAIKTKYFNIL